MNAHASKYGPFQCQYLIRRGCPRSNNALPMVPEVQQSTKVQQSTTVASIQSRREMQHHPTFLAMSEVQQSTTVPSIQSHRELQHAQLVYKSPIGDLQEVQHSTTVAPIQGHMEMQGHPTFLAMPDTRNQGIVLR